MESRSPAITLNIANETLEPTACLFCLQSPHRTSTAQHEVDNQQDRECHNHLMSWSILTVSTLLSKRTNLLERISPFSKHIAGMCWARETHKDWIHTLVDS